MYSTASTLNKKGLLFFLIKCTARKRILICASISVSICISLHRASQTSQVHCKLWLCHYYLIMYTWNWCSNNRTTAAVSQWHYDEAFLKVWIQYFEAGRWPVESVWKDCQCTPRFELAQTIALCKNIWILVQLWIKYIQKASLLKTINPQHRHIAYAIPIGRVTLLNTLGLKSQKICPIIML